MLAISPDSKMVLVHRVDTENDYGCDKKNVNKMLKLVMDSKDKDI